MQAGVDFRRDIVNGVIKSVVFGIAVSLIAVFEGYDAKPTAEGVSTATTRTVVGGSLAILGARLRAHRVHVPAGDRPLSASDGDRRRSRRTDEPQRPSTSGSASSSTIGIGAIAVSRAQGRQSRRLRDRRRATASRRASTTSAASSCARRSRPPASSSAAWRSIKLDPKTYEAVVTLRIDNGYQFTDGHDRVDPHVRPARRGLHRARRRAATRRCSPTAARSPRRSPRSCSRS